jgi:hypothetical protein
VPSKAAIKRWADLQPFWRQLDAKIQQQKRRVRRLACLFFFPDFCEMNAAKFDLIDKYIAAYNAFDVDGMCACMHPDIRFENWSDGQLTQALDGLDAFRAQAVAALEYFSERKLEEQECEVAWESIVSEVFFSATLAVDLPNGMKAGQELKLIGRSEFRFRDGLIVFLRDES